MNIALLQLKAKKGNISYNIENHLNWIERVASHDPDLIVFPELSITGYEPTLAGELAFEVNDARFNPFHSVGISLNCVIAIGIPLKVTTGVQIAMLIIQPNNPRNTYAKQWLHHDENPYFIRGLNQTIITIDQTDITPAICYESIQPNHLAKCLSIGTDIYMASVCKHAKGIVIAHNYYSQMAARNEIPVLVVNSVGHCDNFVSSGQSAIWNSKGKLISKLDSKKEGFIIYNNHLV